jgi:amidase
MDYWGEAGRKMGSFFETYDLYCTPSTAMPPSHIGELLPKGLEKAAMAVIEFLGLGRLLKMSGIVDKLAQDSLSRVPFTQLANLTGLPAMSVPLYWDSAGLPYGSQFMAPYGDESRLFRLAFQLEEAEPWGERLPPLSA